MRASPAPAGDELVKDLLARPDVPRVDSAPPDFEKLIARVEEALPRREALRALPAEAVHHTPDLVMKAAAQLAELAQAVADRPELAERVQRFYGECARREDVARSIRAHCLARFRKWAVQQGSEGEVESLEAEIPAEVRTLSQQGE